jgi:dienelactone hydrolase
VLRVSICAALVLPLLLAGAAEAVAPLLPAAAFAALPQVSDVELSPDGTLVAWLDRSEPQVKVVIFDLARKSYRRTLNVDPSMTLRSLFWADDDSLLLSLSQVQALPIDAGGKRYTFFRTLAIQVASGKSVMLLMSGGERPWVTGASLVAWHTNAPHSVVMSSFDYDSNAERSEMGTHIHDPRADSGWVGELFQVDTLTGKGRVIDQGDQYADQWVVAADGAPVVRSEWVPGSQYLVQVKSAAGWRQIFELHDGLEWTLHGLSADGKSVIATGPDKSGWVKLWAIALDGSGAKDLLPDAAADVMEVIPDRFSGAPAGVELGGLEPRIRWIDPAAQWRYESVAAAFPGREVAVYSRSQDGSRLIAEVQDRSHPPVYYLVDLKTHRADIVGEEYPALANVTLGSVREITYPARDGTAIPAYLTLPPGQAPKALPMVVLPHGGPESRDTPEFDWLSQFFASRGYAVLQPQFRGSTGFGEAFRVAGRRQWGGLMQNDVTDGIKAMIGQGIADPRRICIVGGSYGGYVALAGAAFTPDLYACAVSINGVSDLPAMLGYEKEHAGEESDQVAYWTRDIGSTFDSYVVDLSPANAAADVEAPVLLLHAADDTVVPIAQSQEMAGALDKLRKPVTLITLAGEDHWLSNAATRLEVLEDTDRFLRQYLN